MCNRSLFLITTLALVCAGLILAPLALAHGHGHDRPVKKGILLISFGSSIPQARQAFDRIDQAAKKRFPGIDIRWAFTSKIIRKKLAKQGVVTLSPSEALAKMAADDFTDVAVQSLHVIPGQEFHDMHQTVRSFEGLPKGIGRIVVGLPLLSTTKDLLRFANVAAKAVIPSSRKPGEAVAFMGHGTHHPANSVYPALSYIFARTDPRIMVGTVEGYPDIELIKGELVKAKVKQVWLIPLMSVAGDHALNDMAGDEPDSWKSQLAQAGLACRPVIKGLAEYDAVVEIWLDHLAAAYAHLGH